MEKTVRESKGSRDYLNTFSGEIIKRYMEYLQEYNGKANKEIPDDLLRRSESMTEENVIKRQLEWLGLFSTAATQSSHKLLKEDSLEFKERADLCARFYAGWR